MKFLKAVIVNLLVFFLISDQAWSILNNTKGNIFKISYNNIPNKKYFIPVPATKSEGPICGVPKQKFLLRLIAGEEAKAETWPWVAAIAYYSNHGLQFNCSGTLISDIHILTSAQCVTPDMRFVKLGALNINSNEGINASIEKGSVHTLYNPQTLQNDIGIIKLTKKLEFTDSVRPICLPFSKELQEKDFTDYTPITAGWKINRGSKDGRDSTLRQYQTIIRSTSECKKAFSSIPIDNSSCICAARGDEEFVAGTGGSLMFPQVRVLSLLLFVYLLSLI